MKREISFTKMVGSGNDFILLNNLDKTIPDAGLAELAKNLCDLKEGIGADGLILLEKTSSNSGNFKMRIINSDGSEAEMCGNGARCAAYFAFSQNIVEKKMNFETLAGLIGGEVLSDAADLKNIKVKMINPHSRKDNINLAWAGLGHHLDTGVPHTVLFVDDITLVDVQSQGSFVRYHEQFHPKGTNVNFVQVLDENNILVRTYERGVEGETLSCGSGSTASALLAALKKGVKSPVTVKTKGGERLKIYFEVGENEELKNVYLEGQVRIVFTGKIEV